MKRKERSFLSGFMQETIGSDQRGKKVRALSDDSVEYVLKEVKGKK